jgi:hypothetical protein
MGSIRFGDAGRAFVSAAPQDMKIARGTDGCAMASDRT